MSSISTTEGLANSRALGAPPLPREHGAWVILTIPLLAGVVLGKLHYGSSSLWTGALLLLAATGAFLARHATRVLLRRPKDPNARTWLPVYIVCVLCGAAPLLEFYHRTALLPVGMIAAGAFLIYALLPLLPGARRPEHGDVGELFGTLALCLTGPAAYVAVTGQLNAEAWSLWAVFAAYFCGGILFVRMLLAAARVKANGPFHRWRIAAPCLGYHALLLPGLLGWIATGRTSHSALLLLALAPALLRAVHGAVRLSRQPPPFKRVGKLETLCTAWFFALYLLSSH